jgi:ribonuclease P protein component
MGSDVPPGRPLGLGRDRRLRRRVEISRVQRRGRRWRGKLLTVVWLAGDATGARLALAVSRKVGNAVRRNKVKRRVREVFRHAASGLPRGTDLLVIATPAASAASFAELSHELTDAFSSIARSVGGRPHSAALVGAPASPRGRR